MEKMIRAKTISTEKINAWLKALTANENVETTVRITAYYDYKGVFTPFSYVSYEVGNMVVMVSDGRVCITRTDYINKRRIEWIYNIAE